MQLVLTIIGYVLSGLQALAPVLDDLLHHTASTSPSTQHLTAASTQLAALTETLTNLHTEIKSNL